MLLLRDIILFIRDHIRIICFSCWHQQSSDIFTVLVWLYIYISRFQPWRLFSDADCWCDMNSNIMFFSRIFLIALHKICRLNHIPWGYQLFIGIKTFDRDLSWLWRDSVFTSQRIILILFSTHVKYLKPKVCFYKFHGNLTWRKRMNLKDFLHPFKCRCEFRNIHGILTFF